MTNTMIFADATAYVADLRRDRNALYTRPIAQPELVAAHDAEAEEAADDLIASAYDLDPRIDNPTIETAYLTTLAFLAIGADNASFLNVYALDPQIALDDES